MVSLKYFDQDCRHVHSSHSSPNLAFFLFFSSFLRQTVLVAGLSGEICVEDLFFIFLKQEGVKF